MNDRLAWVEEVTGYNENAAGALYPGNFLSDGSIETDGFYWSAGEESAVLCGMFTWDELADFAEHMELVPQAIGVGNRPKVRFQVHLPKPSCNTIRNRIGRLLMRSAVAVMGGRSDSDCSRMLWHLEKYWRCRWFDGVRQSNVGEVAS